jgi:hypothetical protein
MRRIPERLLDIIYTPHFFPVLQDAGGPIANLLMKMGISRITTAQPAMQGLAGLKLKTSCPLQSDDIHFTFQVS